LRGFYKKQKPIKELIEEAVSIIKDRYSFLEWYADHIIDYDTNKIVLFIKKGNAISDFNIKFIAGVPVLLRISNRF